MTYAFSLFLIAVGAIFRYAMNAHQWSAINIHIVGAILMIIGILGLAVSFIVLAVAGVAMNKAKNIVIKHSDRHNDR